MAKMEQTTQAMILAAGMGKRLGKYTQDGTKCMVCVNGKALIEHALDALQAAGVFRVIIVVGYRADKLIAFLSGRYPRLELVYVMNEIYDKTNNIYSLWLARNYLAEADTLLLESDLIFEPELLADLMANPEPNLAVVAKFEAWMDGTVTLVDDERNIVTVVDKKDFAWKRVEDYYKTVNIYKFSAEFSRKYYLPFLDAYLVAFGDNQYYEQVLKVLAFLDGVSLKAHEVGARKWYEIDDPNDLEVAQSMFQDGVGRLELMQSRYGGYWRFPKLLDYCYLVNPYFPPERLLEEVKCSFRDLVTQYPSGAKVQSSLAGKVFGVDPEHIVVGNGAAELIDVAARLLPGKVLVPQPSFNEYPARFGADRTQVMDTCATGFTYSAVALELAMVDADLLVVVNPDNPSGHFMREAELKGMVDRLLAKGKRVIVDESFADFADKGLRFTLLENDYLSGRPGLIVIKSISKSYGVPGFRLGVMASGDVEFCNAARKAPPVWNINSFGEFFLQIVDKYKADYRAACDLLAAERVRFASLLAGTSMFEVYPSQANYLLCRLKARITASELAQGLLLDYEILIKDLSGKRGFPEGQFIRIAVRGPEDNDRLVEAIKTIEINLA